MDAKRMIFAFLVATIFVGSVFGQSRALKEAQKMMDDLNYVGAIAKYNKILEKNDNADAKINLAECYRKVSDSENAEYWYGQVVRLPEAEPVHKLYYGQSLQRNGKCDLAKEWYENYVREVPDDLRGQYLVKACDYEEELRVKNAGIYEITHLDINSGMDDFSPAYFGDGMVFASERDKGSMVKRLHCWTGNPFLELFYVETKETGEECGNWEYSAPEKFNKDINGKLHDAVVTFNQDQSKIFFTRNNYVGGKTGKSDDNIIKLKVFSADKKGDGWGDLEGLPFNSDEYSVAHPTLTPDGKYLYFSSDMPGGFGGMDLYVSEEESGRWGPPMNLGPSINTEGNEIFPYYQKDGLLYFSSDGQIGLGGLDIYSMQDLGGGAFGPIDNIGYPINTISDDFGLIFNGEGTCGHFSSDREGGTGRDDIYSFKKIASPVEVLVFDEETKEPIEGATVVNDCTGATFTTNAEGKAIVDMKMDICCNFQASMEEYLDNEMEGCTKDIPVGERVFVEIPLSKESLFDIEGIVFDQSTGLPLEGATVELMNDCEGEVPEPIITDATGRYTFKLDKDCCYTVKGTKEGYFGSPVKDQCTRDLVEATTLQANINLQPATVTTTQPVQNPPTYTNTGSIGDPCLNLTQRSDGVWIDKTTGLPADIDCGTLSYRGGVVTDTYKPTDSETFPPSPSNFNKEVGESVSYLLHIYYDFDQSYIRGESEPELNKLLNMLKNQSELIIELGSHTDSRGSNNYNRRLSQRRAESVVRWLVDKGISRDRLVPRGYGETQNVNNCVNNVPCSEREHQMNRRTEFRILGCLGCSDEVEISKPNDGTEVDECLGCPF